MKHETPRKNAFAASRYTLLTAALFLGLTGCEMPVPETAKAAENFFPPAEVCSYPADGPIATFRNLGGGNWGPSDPANNNSALECVGANRTVQLHDDTTGKIEIEYRVKGIENGGTMVVLRYSANGGRAIPNESTYRNMFANLVENTARLGLKDGFPDLYRRRMSNLESFSREGKAVAETYDVGSGFVSVTREASEDRRNLSIEARIFPDVALKLTE